MQKTICISHLEGKKAEMTDPFSRYLDLHSVEFLTLRLSGIGFDKAIKIMRSRFDCVPMDDSSCSDTKIDCSANKETT